MRNGIEIRIARNQQESEQIFRFRYRIYVEEMHRKQHYADHDQKRIQDPLDADATNFGAWRGGEIVGVVRVNFPRDADIGTYENFYDMPTVGADHPCGTSIVTRLMVVPSLRSSWLAFDLAAACYRYGLLHGIKWSFIDCNEHLEPFFQALGYVAHVPRAVHPEYGLVTPMRLELRSLAHLKSVRSPFAAILEKFETPARATPAPIFITA